MSQATVASKEELIQSLRKYNLPPVLLLKKLGVASDEQLARIVDAITLRYAQLAEEATTNPKLNDYKFTVGSDPYSGNERLFAAYDAKLEEQSDFVRNAFGKLRPHMVDYLNGKLTAEDVKDLGLSIDFSTGKRYGYYQGELCKNMYALFLSKEMEYDFIKWDVTNLQGIINTLTAPEAEPLKEASYPIELSHTIHTSAVCNLHKRVQAHRKLTPQDEDAEKAEFLTGQAILGELSSVANSFTNRSKKQVPAQIINGEITQLASAILGISGSQNLDGNLTHREPQPCNRNTGNEVSSYDLAKFCHENLSKLNTIYDSVSVSKELSSTRNALETREKALSQGRA